MSPTPNDRVYIGLFGTSGSWSVEIDLHSGVITRGEGDGNSALPPERLAWLPS